MQNIKATLFKYSLILLALPAISQSDSTTQIKLNQVEVIKSFEANLEEALKISIKPVLPLQKEFNPTYKYDITIVPIDLQYQDPQIRPLSLDTDPPFKINNGYLSLGYGILKNPEIMAGYHLSVKDSYEAGIHVGYRSLDNSSENAYQKYNDLNFNVYGSYMAKENIKVYGNIKASSDFRYFYNTHLNVGQKYTERESERILNTMNIKAGITNAERTLLGINYDFNLNLNNLNITNPESSENGIVFNGHVEKHLGKSNVFYIDGKLNFTELKADSLISLTSYNLRPILKTQFGGLIASLGVNYIQSGTSLAYLFPDIMISYGVIGQNVQVFAGLHQDYYLNSLRNAAELNPYLDVNLKEINNSVFKDFFGGVKGQFSFLTYQIKAGYKEVDRQMFFLNKRSDRRVFDILYDDMKNVYVSGNLNFLFSENISLGGWINQNVYTPKTLITPFHLPNLEASFEGKISLLNSKLNISSQLFFNDRIEFLDKTELLQKSNVLFDFNIIAEYRFNKNFSATLKGINLFDNKYERWYGYPSVGINGMVGINLVF